MACLKAADSTNKGTGRIALVLLIVSPAGLLLGTAVSIVTETTWPGIFGMVWFLGAPLVALTLRSGLAPVCTRHHRSRWERYFWCKQTHRSDFLLAVAITSVLTVATAASLVMTNEVAFALLAFTTLLALAATVPRRSALRPPPKEQHLNHGRTTSRS